MTDVSDRERAQVAAGLLRVAADQLEVTGFAVTPLILGQVLGVLVVLLQEACLTPEQSHELILAIWGGEETDDETQESTDSQN